MSTTAHQTIEDEFIASVSDLIECYTNSAPHVVPADSYAQRQSTAAIVGFGDAKFRGSAVLLAKPEVAGVLSETTPLNPTDWLGELCNQLVGRLKNKLAKYGLLPQMGTPITVAGQHLDLGAVSSQPFAWRVSWEDGHLFALLTLEVEDGLELVADDSAAIAEEGSLNLF